jgi:hydrogenase maturation protease
MRGDEPAATRTVAPRLVLGLGNPLMGDDGVGFHVVEALRVDPRLPPDVEVAFGGTDLLACAGLLGGRQRIVLVDAVAGERTGEGLHLDPLGDELALDVPGAHALSLPSAVHLLRLVVPDLRAAEVELFGVTVSWVALEAGLSPALQARLPALVDEVLAAATAACADCAAVGSTPG